MNNFSERYASAVSGGNMKSEPDTTMSNTDVLGAMGYVGKVWRTLPNGDKIKGRPLAAALFRVFMAEGDSGRDAIAIMAQMLTGRAPLMGLELNGVVAEAIAENVLDWHRKSVCAVCHGHGYKAIGGEFGKARSVIGDEACGECGGSGKRPFDAVFTDGLLPIAHWLRDRVEAETNGAASAAMAALAPSIDP